jgi:hypothetical protein
MNQITKTVEQFLSFIVGMGLVCFTAFVFLLASAQLNESTLGTLLAEVAGETAYTARTKSFSYWGKVGQEVADGLGYGQVLAGGATVVPTPVVIVATNPPPAPGATAVPPTVVPAQATNALLLWRGLNSAGLPMPFGVSLKKVQDEANWVLTQDPNNLLAKWLLARVQGCQPDYNTMIQADYTDGAQANTIIAAATNLIGQCNQRLYEAYARQRWAQLAMWVTKEPLDEASASKHLAGLTITLGNKLDGPARLMRPEDKVLITINAIPEFGLRSLDIPLSVGALNGLLGEGLWQPNGGTFTLSGQLYPANPPEPVLPSDAEISPPAPTATPNATNNPNLVATTVPAPPSGKYVVQTGDTVYGIAKKFNITVDALIAANPTTLGVNANYIIPGQELIIPAAK